MKEVSITSYKIASNAQQITEINSVLLPDGRQPPDNLFTALYGIKDSLHALQEAKMAAYKQGLMTHRADMKVHAGIDSTSRITADLAQNAVFIHLARLDQKFEAGLIQYIAPGSTELNVSSIIDENPALLHKVFDYPELPVVNVIVWPASYKNEEKLQMVTIKDVSQISVKNTTGSFIDQPTLNF